MSVTPTEAARVPIPPSDQTWLHMDRPNNLMHVHSLMWFEGNLTLPQVRKVIQERMVDRFPVFRRRAIEVDGHWVWEEDTDFDIKHHLRRDRLPAPNDADALRDYISRRFSEEFDRSRPLWDMTVLGGVHGLADGPVTVTFSRFHHALADGVRLVQMMLSLCDVPEAPALPPSVGRAPGGGVVSTGVDVVKRGTSDAVDVMRGVGAGALKLPRAATRLRPASVLDGLDLVRHPSRLLDAATSLTSTGNQSVNTVTELTKLMASGRSVETAWSGTPGVRKGVDWVVGLDLARVKRFGRLHGATVNDVLLGVISRALSRYLGERNAAVDEIHWLVPVSLLPFDANLPEELGNHFSLVYTPMPMGIQDPDRLLSEIRMRTTRIKESAEPVVTFGIQWVLAESPKNFAVALTNFFANKCVGVLTNVPGPTIAMTFAGVPVAGTLGWAPTSGDQPMSLSIFSYNGQVNIAVAADAHLIPDPDRIAALIAEEFDTFLPPVG